MKRALMIAGMWVGGTALAGGHPGGSGISFVPSRPYVNLYVSTPLVQQPVVTWPYFTWYYPVPQAPPPPPAPTVIYIEREPAPPPQVIVVPQPAPVVVEVPAAPPPAPVAAVAPPPPPAPVAVVPAGPRTPGPDVFAWTDEDGVVNYSTRAPANGQAKAKKLATLAK